ncbi:MAG TPA: hypothetical protein VLL08_07555, partial [Kineosporiaceae bacterium]|nr:hypothetical protein [Kineosporiaceae bacterium]
MRIPVDGSSTARHPRPATRATPNSATSASPGLLPPQKSDHLDTQSVLALQRRAGNSSVNRLLRTVQRKPLSKDDDPDGYSSEKGKANVAGSGTTRREVHGLKYGISGGFKSRYPSAKNPKGTSDESSKTKQNPDHMAVVIMPDKVDPRRPVQVILHFTGYGFRSGDPYAGYTVAAGGQRKIKQGTVRDVDQEHWEQQIGAVNKDRVTGGGAQVVAVLAQGRGRSEFGEVPTFDYVRDVFANVAELSAVAQYSIILSGHSGGGATQVAAKVADGSAQTADRTALPAAQPAKPGQSAAAAAQPTDLVVLFDAEGIERVTTWATGRISALAAAIKAAKTPAEAKAAIAASPKFRGYYDESGGYAKRYVPQNDVLWQALAQVPAPWAHPDPANPTVVTVEDLFRIVPVSGAGVDHEHVISGGTGHPAEEGALADALRASADPTRDRASGLKPQAAGSSRRRKRSKSKSKSKSKSTPTPTPTSPQQSP